MNDIKLFIRQSYTEADADDRQTIQGVLDLIRSRDGTYYNIDLLTGAKAYTKDNFKDEYKKETGFDFTPDNFRTTRFELLNNCDGMVIIRTGLSESTAFEVCYNIFSGKNVPMLFLVHEQSPIRTTLIQDLDLIAEVKYQTFSDPCELDEIIDEYLNSLNRISVEDTEKVALEHI